VHPLQRAVTNERRGKPPLPPHARRVASILALAGVARLAEIAADIGTALAPCPAPILTATRPTPVFQQSLKSMKTIASIMLLLAVALGGCKTFSQKQKLKQTELNKKAKVKLRESSDVDFYAFLGRLRKAVAARDKETIKSMMTDDFGYKLNPAMQGIGPTATGPGVFQYWDDQDLWPELEGILSEKFVKYKGYMVAPPQFADPSLNYDAYRAGITRVNGSWKFAYFVNGSS
jgi:hypothetical protein